MPKIKQKSELPDIQNLDSGYPQRLIKKVGIRNVRVPIKVDKKDGGINDCSAEISIYTDLTAKCKGTNMSRYRILIEEFLIEKNVKLHDLIRCLLLATRDRLESENAFVKIRFPYYLVVEAPASKLKSYIDLRITFEGKLRTIVGSHGKKELLDIFLTVRAPYTSLCPCSKEISDYGAHNQRSYADVTVKLNDEKNGVMWIEDIFAVVNKCASAPIINGLKREDEAFQTELMYEHPKFVEDMVREVAVELDKELDKRILDYSVVVNHEESIHTHDAVAVITAGREIQ
jgi:GTP cyclohydrolase I